MANINNTRNLNQLNHLTGTKRVYDSNQDEEILFKRQKVNFLQDSVSNNDIKKTCDARDTNKFHITKDPNKSNNDKSGCSFTTAAGNFVSVKSSSLDIANKLFNEINDSGTIKSENQHDSSILNDTNKSTLSTSNKYKASNFTSKKSLLNSASKLYKKIKVVEGNCLEDKEKLLANSLFTTAAGSNLMIKKSSLNTASKIFEDIDTDETINPKTQEISSFKTAAENHLSIKTSTIDDLNINSENQEIKLTNSLFKSALGSNLTIKKSSLNTASKLFEEINDDNISTKTEEQILTECSFKTAAGSNLKINKSALSIACKIFDDINKDENIDNKNEEKILTSCSFKTAAGTNLNIKQSSLNSANKLFENISENEISNPEHHEGTSTDCTFKNVQKSSLNITNTSVKETNVSKNISINNVSNGNNLSNKNRSIKNSEEIKQEKMLANAELFEMPDDFFDVDMSMDNFENTVISSDVKSTIPINSQLKNELNELLSVVENSEYMSQLSNITKDDDVIENCDENRQSSSNCLENGNTIKDINQLQNSNNSEIVIDTSICINDNNLPIKTKNNIENRYKSVIKNIISLKEKMSILNKRRQAMIKLCERQNNSNHIQPSLGVLYKQKLNKLTRISLQTLLKQTRNLQNSSNNVFWNHQYKIDVIDDSCNVMLSVPSLPHEAVFETPDRAFVIPSESDKVTNIEIEDAFLTMPGVNTKLIPCNWFENHLRLIVWKLNSMDQHFSRSIKQNFLTIENVMLQLKYRYDRDIYLNQRSAIRMILEKDESASRRMVLCISKIILLPNDQYELELTDGWYCIKTIIDDYLKTVLKKKRLTIGTKIITQGAELLNNADGHHPLQMPENVKLKICANRTRRVKWDMLLGFQKLSGPILISLDSIHPDGGSVGCVLVYIARVFPFKYFEKYPDGRYVVRCGKAENRKDTLWQAEQSERRENAHRQATEELEKEMVKKTSFRRSRLNTSNVKSIVNPEELLEIIEDDPSVEALITESQRRQIRDYQNKKIADFQKKLADRMKELTSAENQHMRKVYPTFQIILADVKNPVGSHPMTLTVWNQTESVANNIRENQIMIICDLVINKREQKSLNTCNYTKYSIQTEKVNLKNYEFLSRTFTPISETLYTYFSPILNFFDTAGIVFHKEDNKTVWLADENHNTLCLEQKICPSVLEALKNVNIGDVVAVINLSLWRGSKIVKGIISWPTVFQHKPSHRHLTDAVEKLKTNLPEDTESYILKIKLKSNLEI